MQCFVSVLSTRHSDIADRMTMQMLTDLHVIAPWHQHIMLGLQCCIEALADTCDVTCAADNHKCTLHS